MCMLAISFYVFNGGRHFVSPLEYAGDRADSYDAIPMNSIDSKKIPINSFDNNKSPTVKKIKVYVTGEVRNPGIYEVAGGLRAGDAIKLAGGLTEAAKVEGVNLTKIIRDGMQIKVPALKKNEAKKFVVTGEKQVRVRSFKRPKFSDGLDGTAVSQGFAEEIKVPSDYRVCVNTATFRELVVLPGIYDELARRIIAYRKKQPYIMREDLLNVEGMNRIILKKIDEHIYL
ncbi:MAG: SLBB domain-containing protein [Acidaminococcaceae bacterium]|nr:SLBB domain-containing protein [Acidaminococcaceae bacterium]